MTRAAVWFTFALCAVLIVRADDIDPALSESNPSRNPYEEMSIKDAEEGASSAEPPGLTKALKVELQRAAEARNFILALDGSAVWDAVPTKERKGLLDYAATLRKRVMSRWLADIEKRPGVKRDPQGFLTETMRPGTNGPTPNIGNVVNVKYSYALWDGTPVYETNGVVEINIKSVPLLAFQEAVVLMTKGTRLRVYTPWRLGFGNTGQRGGAVPPVTSLVLDIELHGIALTDPLPGRPTQEDVYDEQAREFERIAKEEAVSDLDYLHSLDEL